MNVLSTDTVPTPLSGATERWPKLIEIIVVSFTKSGAEAIVTLPSGVKWKYLFDKAYTMVSKTPYLED